MGLDRDFLAMLTHPVLLQRKTSDDAFGNETYEAPGTTEQAFIDATNSGFGADAGNARKEKPRADETTLYMDAVGVEPGDKITYDGSPHWVTGVETLKDEDGTDLFQTVTVTNTKRG